MGFQPEEGDNLVASFSGGWKMRIGLGKILLTKPNILLLDEPTNHLDLESIEWMEQFLINMQHEGDPGLDTGDFEDQIGKGPGNLRVDYVLPSQGLRVLASGVFWPLKHEPLLKLAEVSDHRLVWLEFALR